MTYHNISAILWLGLFVFNNLPLQAQLHGKFRSLTVDDGLAQNSVWDMVQDSSGYYWFATADGISRYDGENFKNYKNVSGAKMTIFTTSVGNFFLDSRNRVWITNHYNNTTYPYNRLSDRFDLELNGRVIGESEKGIWLRNENHLVLLDAENLKEIEQIEISGQDVQGPVAIMGLVQNDGKIYMASRGSLEILDTHSGKFQRVRAPENFGGPMLILNDSTIFCISLRGRFLIDSKRLTFTDVEIGIPLEMENAATDMHWYNGQILIGSSAGLFILSPETMKVVQLKESFENSSEPEWKFIQSIYVDKNNVLFLGTNGNGIKLYSPFENRFPTYSARSAPANMVKSICVMPDGKLITGTYDHGLCIFDGYNEVINVKTGDRMQGVGATGLIEFDKDRVLAVAGKRLILFNIRELNIEKEWFLFERNVTYTALKRQKDAFLIASDTRILELDENLKLSTRIQISEEFNLTLLISTYDIANGQTYIGTGSELMIIDSNGNLRRNLLKEYVKCIKVIKDRLYVSCQKGLYEMTLEGEVLLKHDISTGLANDFIYGILEDDFGYLWISHNKGISRIKPGTNEYLQFDVTDGLQSNEFNTGAFYKHTDGKLYFGGVSGINVIDPAHLVMNSQPPKVVFNQVNLFDQPLKMDSAVNELNQLQFAYSDNTLSFDFSASDCSQPGSVVYAYKMQGLDENWIDSGDKHFARYANLPPGNYTFQVKAANGDGVWMQTPKSIDISIVPPYWQALWFRVVMVFVGIALIVFILLVILARQKVKLRRELEVQHKLELERIRISRDLHDNVGAQLSYLITNMEWIADHPDSLDQQMRREQLKQLSDTGRQAITTLRQTIWAISQNEICVEEFADRFKQFAMKMVEYKPTVRLHFHENITEKVVLAPAIALNLFRICQEAFNNAIKHSGATEFDISFSSDQSCGFAFELRDNGVGFETDQSGPAGHYGLENMKARAKESDAALTILSESNRGTTVMLIWSSHENAL